MHPRLDRDVRVGDAGGDQLAQRAEQEGDEGRDAPLLLQHVLQLLEDRVLQDGIDDEDERRHDAREQRLRPLLLEQRGQRADGARRLRCRRAWQRRPRVRALPRRHARVDDPDRVGEEHRRGAGDGAGHHGLEGCELCGAAGLAAGGLEGGARPLVPVVVDEVGDADAEEGGVEAGVEAGGALAVEDRFDGREEGGARAGGLDLGARGEGD